MPNPARPAPGTPPRFVDPTEELFARILDYYGLDWEYEPCTFPLEWDEHGITEAFTPDFYLPAQDLYIELTTLRTRLATFKNRRIRRMQELYPNIHVKLIKRREMREMMEKYGLYQSAAAIEGDTAQHTPLPREDEP